MILIFDFGNLWSSIVVYILLCPSRKSYKMTPLILPLNYGFQYSNEMTYMGGIYNHMSIVV